MKYGIATFITDETITADALGPMLEERGFESLWLPEHTHIPAARATPYPGGTDLPREYARSLDPFIALALAGAVTQRLILGTAVCLVAQHDPIVLAKVIASVEHVSGGRLALGIGAGWNREEMANHGLDPRQRFGVMRETIEAMRTLWTQPEATYAGSHIAFDRIWMDPKPRQPNGPPVLIGGHGAKAEQRVLTYGDGWMPRVILEEEDVLLQRVTALRRKAEELGRDVSVTLYMAPARPAHLARYEAAGVDRCIFYVNAGGPDAVERRLDQIGDALREYDGA